MTRPALTPRIRDELLKLLLDEVANNRAIAAKTRNLQVRDAESLTRTEHTLLLLAGAVFGDAAELELARLIEWGPRCVAGESWWLSTATARAIERKTAA